MANPSFPGIAGEGRWFNSGRRSRRRLLTPGLGGNAANALAEYALDPTTDYPVILTDVAWTTGPFDPPAYEALPKVSDIEAHTGKQQALDAYQPGAAAYAVDSSDRSLDSKHATGVHFGNIKPRRRIRTRIIWGSRYYDLYYGYLNDPANLTLRPPSVAVAHLAATDFFGIAGKIELPASVYKLEQSVDAMSQLWKLNESTTDQNPADSISGNTATFVGTPTISDTGLIKNDRDTCFTFDGTNSLTLPYGLPSPPWTLVVWLRKSPTTGGVFGFDRIAYHSFGQYFVAVRESDVAAPGTAEFIMHDASPGESTLGTIGARVDDGAPHMIAISTTNALTFRCYRDGVLGRTGTFGVPSKPLGPSEIAGQAVIANAALAPFIGSVGQVAIYPSELGVARLGALYDAGHAPWNGDKTGARFDRLLDLTSIPAESRNIDRGLTTLGHADIASSKLMDYARRVEASEAGGFYVDHQDGGKIRSRDRARLLLESRSQNVQAYFSDDPTDTTAYRYEPDGLSWAPTDQLIFNDITVNWSDGSINRTDATSRRDFGRCTKTIDTVYKSANEAIALGEWVLSHYKDEIERIQTLTLRPSADHRLFLPALALKEGDLVSIRCHPLSIGSAFTMLCLVEGKEQRIGSGRNDWETVLSLSLADTQSYFIWGVSLWGTTTRWFF